MAEPVCSWKRGGEWEVMTQSLGSLAGAKHSGFVGRQPRQGRKQVRPWVSLPARLEGVSVVPALGDGDRSSSPGGLSRIAWRSCPVLPALLPFQGRAQSWARFGSR